MNQACTSIYTVLSSVKRKTIDKTFTSILILMLGACVSEPTIIEKRIVTVPAGAQVIVNDQDIGISPAEITVDTSNTQALNIQVRKDGFFTETTQYSLSNIQNTERDITIALTKSPMWEATTPSTALNQWLILLVNEDIPPANVWSTLINLISEHYAGIKAINFQLGSAESNTINKRFQTIRGDVLLRSKMLITRPSEHPLTYKVKVITEWSLGTSWQPYHRVFVEDEQLIKMLFERFGG